ncbi:hypothetical protein NQ317_019237 [Molorchus minor]|uniref:C3H1-type domain-containing protein n=1 Tax=Molorchus minor TaxID=1323400 RepID=A0ABQ9JQ21_9CUCU|nr:hypothetical protein NQ317_019237 [Molorchus minor]
MLEVLFQFTGIEVLEYQSPKRTVDCYFYQQSRCKKGSLCRYRHHPTLRTLSGTERCLRRGQCNESASSVPSTALSPLTSREHDLTTRRADSAAIKKCLDAAGNIAEYSNTFDGNQEQRGKRLTRGQLWAVAQRFIWQRENVPSKSRHKTHQHNRYEKPSLV